jgi:hypothetical protein
MQSTPALPLREPYLLALAFDSSFSFSMQIKKGVSATGCSVSDKREDEA